MSSVWARLTLDSVTGLPLSVPHLYVLHAIAAMCVKEMQNGGPPSLSVIQVHLDVDNFHRHKHTLARIYLLV